MGHILELKSVDKFYGTNHVVKNLNLNVFDGEFLTILGPSGCGKTTTLRMIGGFEIPSHGSIILNDKDITKLPPYKREVNTVFQNYALFPNMTVAQNIAFGLKQKKWDKSRIAKKVDEVLEMVRMEIFKQRKPMELSGGQQQRVAIARAVANDPKILLLDEPLGALDLKLRKEMQSELKTLHNDLKKTFVYVTHDQEEALTMSDRIAVMNAGVVEQISSSEELYYQPKTKFIADFIGEANVIKAKVTTKDKVSIGGQSLELKMDNVISGNEVDLFIRPEHIILNTSSGKIQGKVQEIIFVGTVRKYKIGIDGGITIVATETTLKPSLYTPDQLVYMDWDSDKVSVF
ncbi:MAG: ABC transporter ATP-binding protein [Cyclobacteriaceae bacterium]|nr:ABC transporter ATP-binding protein [Cyclobacteriaceae bacterium HetDA_MAG_MS6]